MVYSDTSGKSGIIQRIELLTSLGDATISGNATLLAQFTGLINSAYHGVVTAILQSQSEWDFDDINYTDYPIATTPMTTNRDYTFPASLKILKVKRVDVSYDGTNYYKAEPFDTGETGLGLGNDTNTDGRFSKTAPMYDLLGNALRLYPKGAAADVSASGVVRIEFLRSVDEFSTSDTTQVPYIDVPFDQILAYQPAYEWAMLNNLSQTAVLKGRLDELMAQLRNYYGQKDLDREHIMKPANLDYS